MFVNSPDCSDILFLRWQKSDGEKDTAESRFLAPEEIYSYRSVLLGKKTLNIKLYLEVFSYLCTLKYLTGTSSLKIQTLCQ